MDDPGERVGRTLFISNIPLNAEDLVEVGGHDGKRLEGGGGARGNGVGLVDQRVGALYDTLRESGLRNKR